MKRFGAYEILHELSSGGMGAVLLGRKRGPGGFERLVAIKTIRAEYAASPTVRAMFLDEAAILSRLTHPGIATVHDFGEHDGVLYMVMEYVAGTSLRQLIETPTPPVVLARAIAEACRGLHAAHEVRDGAGTLLGLVHRDVSPDNLMLGFDGHIKVIDFGIALVKNRQAPVTEFGTVKGKPPYMSPEQVKNEPMDRRSDVFSIAVVLYELLTHTQLFDGDSIYAIALAVEQKPIVPPSVLLGTPLPAGLDAAVMRALARDPADRTATAAELADELERVVAAAAGETLQAWADRELAEQREANRRWLARVLGGEAAAPIGRATGASTAIAPIADPSSRAREPEPEPQPAGASRDAGTGATSFQPARRRFVPIMIAVLVALAAGIAVVMLRGGAPAGAEPADAAVAIVAPLDAALDATEVEARIDTGVIDAAVADAAVEAPIDARDRRPRDAGRRPRDAPARPVDAGPLVRDAAPAASIDAAAVGFGTLNIRARRGTYAQVSLDGKPLGPTPILGRKVPAGSHRIELIPPVGEDVYRVAFELAPGQVKNITQPGE